MKYLEDAKYIWKTYVPKSGQAETVQGELMRAVEKLRWESLNNGNMNWDKGFEILIDYLKEKLTDKKVFSNEDFESIKSILSRIGDFDHPYLEDNLYDELLDRVVEYYKFYGSQVHQENPNLYR